MQSFKEEYKKTTVIKKFEYLSKELNQYKHRWGPNPSKRMMKWVDEYELLRKKYPEAYGEYCRKYGFETNSTAYDCLA